METFIDKWTNENATPAIPQSLKTELYMAGYFVYSFFFVCDLSKTFCFLKLNFCSKLKLYFLIGAKKTEQGDLVLNPLTPKY